MDECLRDGTEPKAPDKSLLNNIENCNNSRICYDPSSPDPVKVTERTEVSDLDEPGLRALLDEAFSYKNPKDAQGKSELFKELLQSVDSDSKNSMNSGSERARKPRRQSNRKDLEKSYCSHGSLQDLINVLATSSVIASDSGDSISKSKETLATATGTAWKTGIGNSCSATLQSGFHEPVTIRYLDEISIPRPSVIENGSCDDAFNRRVLKSSHSSCAQPSSSSAFGPSEIRRTLSSGCLEKEPYKEISNSYKSLNSLGLVAALEKDDVVTTALREKFTERAVKNCDENANSLNANPERKGKVRRLKAKNDKNTILSEHIEGHRSDIAQDIDAVMKYIESPSRSDNKSNRQRVNFPKSSSSRTVSGGKLRPIRDKSSDTVRKGRKSKESKFQKSSSLEEVCISTFEDLTSSGTINEPKTSIPDDKDMIVRNQSPTEKLEVDASQEINRNSNKVGTSSSPFSMKTRNDSIILSLKKDAADNDTDSEFFTVTKKQRKKKNTTFPKERSRMHKFTCTSKKPFICESKERCAHAFQRPISRRKSTSSVPSTEKSDDSSDDGDSVHSLPISSEACAMHDTCISTVSYAAIARAAPEKLLHSSGSRFLSDGDNVDCSGTEKSLQACHPVQDEVISMPAREVIPTVMLPLPSRKEKPKSLKITNEDYPPLYSDSSTDMYVEYTVSIPRKGNVICQSVVNVEKTVVVKTPNVSKTQNTLKHVDKNCSHCQRPAVVMCDSACSPCDVKDLEFGFDVSAELISVDDELSLTIEDVCVDAVSEIGFEDSSVSSATPCALPHLFLRTPEESVLKADPAMAFVMTEWNNIVLEIESQDAGGPKVVHICDC